ncbi:MAG: SLC13 family permease, partial [Gemmatimonadota bacterium]|nr:SLC13 family permease [Gemmatimonadota bacterium]
AFLNNTPLVAMLIPIVRDLARTGPLKGSKLYMPISFASMLGGTCTLIGTSVNIIIGGMVLDTIAQGAPGTPDMRPLGVFDPSLVAVPAAVLGVGLMILGSKWLFPDRDAGGAVAESRKYLAEFAIPPGSPLAGRSLTDAGFIGSSAFELVSFFLPDGTAADFDAESVLEEGSIVEFSATADMVATLWATPGLRPRLQGHAMTSERHTRRLVEVVVAPGSWVVGRSLGDPPVEDSPYQVRIVGLSRGGRPVAGTLWGATIEVGDNAILEVDDEFFFVNRLEKDLSLTKVIRGHRIQRIDKALTAGVITGAMVATAALGWLSMLNAAMLATGAMLLTGCLTLRTAGRSVDFGTVFVLAAAIGLAAAVTETGLAERIASLLVAAGGSNGHVALAVVFVGRAVMANLITNAASAVFMYPIALSIAGQLGISFMPFAIALMTGTIGAAITPSAYQTNLMVYEPGNYRFADFMRAGIPLTVVVGVVTVFLAPLAFGF